VSTKKAKKTVKRKDMSIFLIERDVEGEGEVDMTTR